ncbi:hypothetical protein [Burkholderia ambifaria]|nr:hypothetical protein [Burkholderia ambifaria]
MLDYFTALGSSAIFTSMPDANGRVSEVARRQGERIAPPTMRFARPCS